MRSRHGVAFLIALAVIAEAAPHESPVHIDRYSLHLSLSATVGGRKYFFFPFKGMLLAESNVVMLVAGRQGAERSMLLAAPAGPNYILMTGTRKATEVWAYSIGERPGDCVVAGIAHIDDWARRFPDWARNVAPQKRNALPFLLPEKLAGEISFMYADGEVREATSRLSPYYPWPTKEPIPMPLFDAVRASLALFNHSPFPDEHGSSTFERRFPVAPALREISVTILPAVRSEVEFTEPGPLLVQYHCELTGTPSMLHCFATSTPGVSIEKGFVLEEYRREALRSAANGAVESDSIRIKLSGKKGNAAELELAFRRIAPN
ncbi:MAG: hypothetical protein AB1714_25260 [Acidobacteriota bacterium]